MVEGEKSVAPGADMDNWRRRSTEPRGEQSWIGWQPGDENPATIPGNVAYQPGSVASTSREMTPNEIREDELKSLAERINLVSVSGLLRPLDVYNEVQRIIEGRIAALHPEQPSVEEPNDPTPPAAKPEPEHGLRWVIDQLASQSEIVRASERQKLKLAAAEIGMGLLTGEPKDLLDRESALLLARAIVSGVAEILLAE